MNGAERRGDQMLLPAFGNPRLTGQQGAKILKRGPLGRHYEQRRCNGGRRGSPPPPTPKRNCYPFAQRHTATPCDRPAAGWRQCDRFFYGPINLAKVLTLDGRAGAQIRFQAARITRQSAHLANPSIGRLFPQPRTGNKN
jgi:hypothetical protein